MPEGIEADLTYPVEWEVPEMDVVFFREKSKPYCVVIPVINEGERLHNLLDKMLTRSTASLADIIIVDGGSTDGSLCHRELMKRDVSVLLVKTGPGKLSAQLLCAYAFAIAKNYAGIITIDGNGKDDPEAIPRFIEKLRSGYDFVQGSRFLENGQGINTPMLRWLAIRVLHAPLLSFASGFHWTDTTQGFRAYSRKLIVATNVAPFRAQFKDYELLPYLSYIAPKRGFKCTEIATTRTYPAGEVPTKIKGPTGLFRVALPLLLACLGAYNARTAGHD